MPPAFTVHRCVCGPDLVISCSCAQLLTHQAAETGVGKKLPSQISLGWNKKKIPSSELNLSKKNDTVLDPCIENFTAKIEKQ